MSIFMKVGENNLGQFYTFAYYSFLSLRTCPRLSCSNKATIQGHLMFLNFNMEYGKNKNSNKLFHYKKMILKWRSYLSHRNNRKPWFFDMLILYQLGVQQKG